MKYVILQQTRTGFFFPFIFGGDVVHADAVKYTMRSQKCKLFGAGFCTVRPNKFDVLTHGSSESLGIGPHPEDAVLLGLFLFHGISGLALSNALMAIDMGLDPFEPMPRGTPKLQIPRVKKK